MKLSRRWLWLVAAATLLLTFAQSPGQISPDTKLDLTANPLRFLARAANLWNSDLPFGQAQNQAYGYLFPHGAFFLAGDLLGLPGWVTQRLWWALLLTVGFWGLLRVAEALGIGNTTSRVIAAAAFALSPRVLTTLGAISSETLPMMLAPWVLLPVILALRGQGSVRVLGGALGAGHRADGRGERRRDPDRVPGRRDLVGRAPSEQAVVAFHGLVGAVCGSGRVVVGGRAVHARPGQPPFPRLHRVLRRDDAMAFVDGGAAGHVQLDAVRRAERHRGRLAGDEFGGGARDDGGGGGGAGRAGVAQHARPAAADRDAAHRADLVGGRLLRWVGVADRAPGAAVSGRVGHTAAQRAQAGAAAAAAAGAGPRAPVGPDARCRGARHGRQWIAAFAHPERDKRVAVGIVVLVALCTATSLAWTGRITPAGAFTAIPQYWPDAADWLDEHNAGQEPSDSGNDPAGRVLVVPGAPFATQDWGNSHDEPLQVLGHSPWGVRDSIPLTPPQTIRALDSVQRLFAAGRPSAGLADTLARQGISYVVVRNDLDPETSRSARPLLVHRAIEGSPGLTKVAQFGDAVGPGTLAGFITDSGLRPKYPAVEVYRVDGAGAPPNPGQPYLTDVDAMARVDGGPEALLRLDERRRLLDQPPLGPILLTSDAQRAGLPTPVVTVTDTPMARETDYGRVDDHSSAIRAPDDIRHTFNRVIDYPAGDADLVYGRWPGGRISASSSAADSTALPNVSTAASPAAAIDGDSSTSWVSNALQAAVGQWLQVDFDRPITNATVTITPSATAVGAQVRRIEVSTATGTSTLRFDEPGKPLTVALPYGETPWLRFTAVSTDDGSPGVQFGITDFTVTQYDASGFAQPVSLRHTVVVPGPPPGSAVAQWDLGTDLLGRVGCADGPDVVRCAATMALSPEEPVNLSRTLTVPEATSVTTDGVGAGPTGAQPGRPDQPARHDTRAR